MKAIARLVWTYLTALPILRWVGVAALASLLFAMLAIWPRTRGFIALPIIAFAIHSLSMTIAAGYLFRVLSSPRSHRFLPHFRGRSLAAFLVIVAVVSAPWLGLVAWAALRPPYAATLVAPLFIMATMVGFTFFPVGASVTFAAVLLIGWLVTQLASAQPELLAALLGLAPMAVTIGWLTIWVAIWAAFSVWYLRVRRIEPIQPPAMILDKLGYRPAAGSVVFDHRSAVGVCLSASYPQGAKQLGGWIALLVLVVSVAGSVASSSQVVSAARAAAKSPQVAFVGAFFVPALVVPGVLLAAVATMRARRTRSLWLKSGLSRRGLLAAAEKEVWRTAVPRALAASVVVATGIALLFEVPMFALGRGLASAAATTVLAVYLGLAFVRDSVIKEAGVAALLIVSAFISVWAAFAAPPRDGVLLATMLSQAMAALVLRVIAIAQWRRIDWLVFKPLRVWSQSLR